jgi:hypothetical protein
VKWSSARSNWVRPQSSWCTTMITLLRHEIF